MVENIDLSEDQEPELNKKDPLFVGFLFVILGVVLIALVYFLFVAPGSWYDRNSREGSYVGKTEEEIIKDNKRLVSDGMMNISIAEVIIFANGECEGEARIDNIEANKRDQKVAITLNQSGELVYESGAIAPGCYIQAICLAKDLEPGTYAATATFTGYDSTTHIEKGSADTQITLVVLA